MTHLTFCGFCPRWMRTLLATSTGEIAALKPLWESLFYPARHTMFQCYAWNRLAAHIFAAKEPAVIVAVDATNGAAIIPAVRRQDGTLGLIGETLFDYRAVLHQGDASALDAAFDKLGELAATLSFTAHRSGMQLPHLHTQLRSFVAAPLALHSAPLAPQPRLKRYLRALIRSGCVVETYRDPGPELLKLVYEQKARQQGSLFTDPDRRSMVVAMCEASGNRCEVFTLECGSVLVATVVTFLDGGCRRCYTTYFNPKWAQFSPGTALLHHVVNTTVEQGLDCDLMTGEQPYKVRLSNSTVQLFHAEVSAESMQRHLASASGEAA